MSAAARLIVALDETRLAPALAAARRLRGVVQTVKIGSALFTVCGPEAIRQVQALGFDVMLDLKFFDIPSTVELSCRAAARHRVSLLTVHARGGRRMLEAAVRGVRDAARQARVARPQVLGVTVLTSDAGVSPARVRREVLRLAQAAREAGCDGVVASAHEASSLRRRFGPRLRIVCPGIRPACPAGRPAGAVGGDDQRRVCTPAEALAQGADALVVGRPITGACNPAAAARAMLEEMESGPC